MGKGRFFGSIAALAALVLVASWWGGCGRSNNQGISFRALGFFADGTGTTGDTGRNVSLSLDREVPNDVDGDGKADGGFLGLENNMLQGIQVQRVDLSYRVTGASISIPNDSYGLSERLGPSSNQETNNPAIKFSQIVIVSPAIFQFINDNRNQFPQPPFSMIATAVGVGVTDSGDPFFTNRVNYEVTFFEGQVNAPTATPATSATPTP